MQDLFFVEFLLYMSFNPLAPASVIIRLGRQEANGGQELKRRRLRVAFGIRERHLRVEILLFRIENVERRALADFRFAVDPVERQRVGANLRLRRNDVRACGR